MLQGSGLTLTANGDTYLDQVDFELRRGRLHTVIGRTLAGKTTMLRVIAGLEQPDRGTLALDGEPFSTRRVWDRDVAMVYQQFINYPHLNAVENVAFPLRRRGLPPAEALARARSELARVGLEGFEGRKPSELSGGQQQRVALARALVRGADILLLDEPLVNLDYKLREQMREELRGLFSDQDDAIVVYTTTEPAEAMMLGDEVLVIHEGQILQAGPPAEVFDRPASTTVAAIINDPPMNIFDGAIEDGRIHLSTGLSLERAAHMGDLPTGRYRFGVRANEVAISSQSTTVGTVTFSEVSGSETFVHVDTPFGSLVIQIEGIHDHTLGERVPVRIASETFFVFGTDQRLVAAP